MARNPKQDANLKPIRKGDLSKEELKKRQSNGGKKSGEVRRAQRDAKSAIRYLLGLPAKGNLATNLKELGLPENEITNMAALQARMFTSIVSTGDTDKYMTFMKMGGYEPEETRKERESLASDRRRDMEVAAKVAALSNSQQAKETALNMNDEDGNSDVVIYMPQLDQEPEPDEWPEDDENVEDNGEDG